MSDTNILLVEDSPEDVDLVTLTLRQANLAHAIFVVKDGEQALDFLFCRALFADRRIDHPPKLVLLDLKLPRIDGMEVLKQIKGDPRTRLIPVVMMTSSREERDVARSYGLGVNSYIQKPVDFRLFQQAVSTTALYWTVINQRPANTEAEQCAASAGQGSA